MNPIIRKCVLSVAGLAAAGGAVAGPAAAAHAAPVKGKGDRAADYEYLDARIPLGERHDNTGLAVLGGAMLLLDGAAVHCATGHCKEGASMSLSIMA